MVLIIGTIIYYKKLICSLIIDSIVLEIIWTILPIFILIRIAYPSISLLCKQDFWNLTPHNRVKLLSSQWNWQRNQREEVDHLVDSFLILDNLSNFRTPLILPFSAYSRIFLTRRDVLHSLGVPRFGVKLDSIPGRLNAISIEPLILGVYPGSCYELCGSGHRAMPIFFLIV